jgi:hypothetical protein
MIVPIDGLGRPVDLAGEHILLVDEQPYNEGPDGTRVTVLDLAGKRKYACSPGRDIKDVRTFNLNDAAFLGTEGRFVASAVGRDAQGDFGVLMWYDPAAGLTRARRTWPITCQYVAAATSGDIWCIGTDVVAMAAGSADFTIFHHYTADGELRESALPRSAFPADAGYFWMFTHRGVPSLRAWDGRMVAWLPAAGTLFEWSAGHESLREIPLPATRPSTDAGYWQIHPGEGGRLFSAHASSSPGEELARRFIHEMSLTPAAGKAWEPIVELQRPELVVGIHHGSFVVWDLAARQILWRPVPSRRTGLTHQPRSGR